MENSIQYLPISHTKFYIGTRGFESLVQASRFLDAEKARMTKENMTKKAIAFASKINNNK